MLTNALSVKKIAAIDKPGMHADGAGLYLKVSPTGAKSWAFVYQWDKKRAQMSLGSLREVSLSVAREKAFEARQAVKSGRDPRAKGDGPSSTKTFGAQATELLDTLEGGWRNEKHRQQWRNTLRTYCKPIWGTPISALKTADVKAVLDPIWIAKPETASRVRGRMERVFAAAKALGHRTGENPAAWKDNLKELMPARPKKSLQRHHPAMPHAQIPAFVARLRQRLSTAARALEFLILTAGRTGEVLGARWSEIHGDIWIVPAARMKMGAEHRVTLTDAAIAVLRRQGIDDQHKDPDGFIFANPRGKALSNMSMEMLLRRMGVDEWTVHGFRSSFRDWAGDETDHPREVAEAALAHLVGSEVERAYRRGDALAKRRLLMNDWAGYVMGAAAEKGS